MTSDQPVVSIFQASFDGAQVNGVLDAPGVLREGAEVNRGIEGLGHGVFHHSFQPAQDPLCLSFPTSRRPLAGFGCVQHVLQLLWVRRNSTANAGWHHWMLTQRVQIFVITFSFIFPCGKCGSPYLAAAATRAVRPMPTCVSVFQVSKQCYGCYCLGF